MEWFYSYSMIPIHVEKLIIGNPFLVIIYVIKSFSLFLFELIIVDIKDYVSSVTLKLIFVRKTLHFNQIVADKKYIYW